MLSPSLPPVHLWAPLAAPHFEKSGYAPATSTSWTKRLGLNWKNSHKFWVWRERGSRGGVRQIFFWGAKSLSFSWFFSAAWNANKFQWFWKVKSKKSSPQFVTFPSSIFNFPHSLLLFSFFSPFFPLVSLKFPGRSVEISQSEVSGGTRLPPCPPPVTPLRGRKIITHFLFVFISPKQVFVILPGDSMSFCERSTGWSPPLKKKKKKRKCTLILHQTRAFYNFFSCHWERALKK